MNHSDEYPKMPPLTHRLDEVMNRTLCGICRGDHDTVKCPHVLTYWSLEHGEARTKFLHELWAKNDPEFEKMWR